MADDRLLPGKKLQKDKPLYSASGQYKLVFQGDGNLVLYEGSRDRWSSKTDNKGATECIMQSDGNLVIYSGPNKVLWASGTDGKRGSFLWVQDDRNLVIYQPIWASNTSV